MDTSNSKEPWTLEEAKAHLPQILRLAEVDGPQYICAEQTEEQSSVERKTFMVMQVASPQPEKTSEKHLGRWLIENTPRGTNLEIPSRHENGREIPFINEADE